jgi:hypothetical protein
MLSIPPPPPPARVGEAAMAYTLIFLVGAVSLATTLLDIFLSDKQKTRLDELSVSIWNWVDEAKRVSIFRHFMRPKWQRIFTAISCIIGLSFLFLPLINATVGLLFSGTQEILTPLIVVALLMLTMLPALFLNWKLFPPVLSYIASSNNILVYIVRAFVATAAAALAIFMSLWNEQVRSLVFSHHRNNADFIAKLLIFAMLLPLDVFFIQSFIISFLAFTVVILILLAYIVLYPLELVLRRIAEYPKGPILAVSALATAIGAFGRFFLF